MNSLTIKFPSKFIHRIFGHVDVISLYYSPKNHVFQNISIQDIDCFKLSKFQYVDCMQSMNRKSPHIVGSWVQY